VIPPPKNWPDIVQGVFEDHVLACAECKGWQMGARLCVVGNVLDGVRRGTARAEARSDNTVDEISGWV
jgi:hypothetical protein